MDLALYSEGVVSYTELKAMSHTEIDIVSKRIEKYLKAKAKANEPPGRFGGGQL